MKLFDWWDEERVEVFGEFLTTWVKVAAYIFVMPILGRILLGFFSSAAYVAARAPWRIQVWLSMSIVAGLVVAYLAVATSDGDEPKFRRGRSVERREDLPPRRPRGPRRG